VRAVEKEWGFMCQTLCAKTTSFYPSTGRLVDTSAVAFLLGVMDTAAMEPLAFVGAILKLHCITGNSMPK